MKRVLTWIKPTAQQLHLWNYFGAVLPMLEFQNQPDKEIFMFVANFHASNQLQNKQEMRENILNVVKTYIACGFDPEKTTIYKQSDVVWHTELSRILGSITNIGFMQRMHAYKDAVAKWDWEKVNIWTFTYPILMAADILLYDADIVPVWKDQKQHAEFARDIAIRFNNIFWETFKLPEPYIPEQIATINWLDWRKMSKSYNNFIGLFEDPKVLTKKIKSIPTDTKSIEDKKNPDEDNVYNILKHFLDENENIETRARYENWGLGYWEVKNILVQKMLEFVDPIQQKANSLSDDYIKDILASGAKKASTIASEKLAQVYEAVGY